MDIKRDIFVVLLIGISATVASDVCPLVENLPDCWCMKMPDGTLRIYCNGLSTGISVESTMKSLKESNVDRKQRIEFIFNRFQESKLRSRVFEGFHVTSLEFQQGWISKWADEEGGPPFVGLEDSLERLNFYRSTLKPGNNGEPPMTLGHLRKLSELKFRGMDVKKFGSDWLGEGLSRLEVLRICDYKIGAIGDEMFAEFKNLKEIELSTLSIEGVKRSMFPNPATHLEKISLEQNQLSVLPDDIFTNMPSLISVNIAYNPIMYFRESVWQPVWSSLDELNMLGTKIACDDHINWMFKLKPPKKIIGNCDSPNNMRRTTLQDLIKKKQQN